MFSCNTFLPRANPAAGNGKQCKRRQCNREGVVVLVVSIRGPLRQSRSSRSAHISELLVHRCYSSGATHRAAWPRGWRAPSTRSYLTSRHQSANTLRPWHRSDPQRRPRSRRSPRRMEPRTGECTCPAATMISAEVAPFPRCVSDLAGAVVLALAHRDAPRCSQRDNDCEVLLHAGRPPPPPASGSVPLLLPLPRTPLPPNWRP